MCEKMYAQAGMHLFFASVANTDSNNKTWHGTHAAAFSRSLLWDLGTKEDGRKDTNARSLTHIRILRKKQREERGALAYEQSLNKSVIIILDVAECVFLSLFLSSCE